MSNIYLRLLIYLFKCKNWRKPYFSDPSKPKKGNTEKFTTKDLERQNSQDIEVQKDLTPMKTKELGPKISLVKELEIEIKRSESSVFNAK